MKCLERRQRVPIPPSVARFLEEEVPLRSFENIGRVYSRNELEEIRHQQVWKVWSNNLLPEDMLGISREEFLWQVPQIPPQPRYGLLNIPLLVIDMKPSRLCHQLGVGMVAEDDLFVTHPRYARTVPYATGWWAWVHDGFTRRGLPPLSSRQRLGRDEVPLTVVEGLSLHAQHPYIVNRGFFLDLAASTLANDSRQVACLGKWHAPYNKAYLKWIDHTESHPCCGVPFRHKDAYPFYITMPFS
jgi:hypothetical protein